MGFGHHPHALANRSTKDRAAVPKNMLTLPYFFPKFVASGTWHDPS